MDIAITERLHLREICEADKDLVVALSLEASLLEDFSRTEGFKEIYAQFCWEEVNSPTTYNCLIFCKESGDFVGKVCMQYIDKPVPELGIDICTAHRGKGYTPEAIIAFCNWYGETHNLDCIQVRISKGNAHSIHVFEKLGARFVGTSSYVSENSLATMQQLLPDANLTELSQDSVRDYLLDLPIK